MKKMYSKALAVMCAVTMALPSTAYTSVYADGDVSISVPQDGDEEWTTPNMISNYDFSEEDCSAWFGTGGTIERHESEELIGGVYKYYGTVVRGEGAQGWESAGQTLTEMAQVLKGYECDYEFWVRLPEDQYAGKSEESRTVQFGPHVEDSEGDHWQGSYSAELSGDNDKVLEPGVWTKFSGTYKINWTGELKQLQVRILQQSGDFLGSYDVTGFKLIPKEKNYSIQEDLTDLRDVIATDEGLGKDAYVGCAVTGTETEDPYVMQLATKHFNAVTLGNELKLDCMLGYNNDSSEKVEFTYVNKETLVACDAEDEKAMKVPVLNFKSAEDKLDLFLDWNKENPDKQIKVRGHVLVWHSQAPGWFFTKNYEGSYQMNTGAPAVEPGEDVSKEEMDRRQEWYIKTMLEHFTGKDSKYKDLFYGWDVVNEAVSDSTGTYRKYVVDGNGNVSTSDNSAWWRIYGDNSFITNAFKYANKYAPASLKLYYNDYNETVSTKADGIVQLLKDVKATKGARIDGFGMQGHYGVNSPTMGQVEDVVRKYSAVVDEVMLTELDVKASNEYDGTDKTRTAEYTKQAYYYKNLYDTLVRLDKEDGINVSGIVVWGTVDKYSWLNDSNNVGGASNGGAQCPLLFDGDYQAKPAYWAFVNPDNLDPYINSIFVVESKEGSFDNANTYAFANDDESVKCEFTPVWDEDTLSVDVKVEGKLADTDKVTLYYSDGEIKSVEVAVKDMEKVEGGYEAVLTVDGAYKVGEAKLDIVVSVGEEKIAFNDIKYKHAESDEFFANANFRPFATVAKGTVDIDGEFDDVWNQGTTVPLTINLGANVKAEAKLLWDENYLYVMADVLDPVLNKDHTDAYQQDSLEVFIDENNKKSDSYQEDDKQYRINYENEHSFNGTKCVEENIKSVAVVPKNGGGYGIEAAFKWTDINPVEGDLIGLELQINDADESGKRIGTLSWYDKSGQGWSAPSVFGTVKLGGLDVNFKNLDSRVKELSEKVNELKEELTDSETANATLNEQLEAAKEELAKAQAELEALKKAEETTDNKTGDKTDDKADAEEAAKVGTVVSNGKFNFVVTKAGSKDGKTVGEVAFAGAKSKKAKTVKVPNTVKVDGVKYKVTSIKAKAFMNNKKLKKVVIGKNVTKIGAKAFANCTNLRKVIVKSKKLKSVGKKAFKGVSKKCKVFAPKGKKIKKAYKKTFKKGGFKGKIK